MSDLQQMYDESSNRIQLAYTGFKAVFEKMTPPPAKPEQKAFNFGWKQWAMAATLIGAVIVSASHVIPVFLGKEEISDIFSDGLIDGIITMIIALAIFVMGEMALVVFAYSATENGANHETMKTVNNFTKVGVIFIAIILIAANVYYTLQYRTDIDADFSDIWGIFRVGIFLLVGAAAPIIALIVGEILAVDVLKNAAANRRELQSYEENLRSWNESLQTAWNRVKGKWGGNVDIQPLKQEPVYLSASEQTDRQGHVSKATDKAYQWLSENPDMQGKPVRELAEIIGVGKDSVAKAKKLL